MSLILLSTCRKDKGMLDYQGYPEEIGSIMINKCATPGCHNTTSKDACAGLDLSSWEKLFRGTRNNSSVIAYRPDQSFLTFFINTYSDLGISVSPSMPVNKTPLSHDEVVTIKNWIQDGAKNNLGQVKFPDIPSRKKLYVANQGCDFVTVFDLQTKLAMRCVNVGNSPLIEVPHNIIVSEDNQYWYVCFVNNSIIQKFKTSDDTKIGEINLPDVGWHTICISPDGKYIAAVHWAGDGKVALINANTMQLVQMYQGSGLFVNPHGCTFSPNGKIIYVPAQNGNFIYKIDISDIANPDIQEIVLEPGELPDAGNNELKPHQVRFAPDDSTRYFVTCEEGDDVRIFNATNDSLLVKISTCHDDEEMTFSPKTHLLFVASYEDNVTFPPNYGCVSIINYQTNTLVKNIYPGFEPHGIAVDDDYGFVYVACRNVDAGGPAPHHTSSCGGRNGYITIIDMKTLEMVNWKTEVSVDPYYIAIKR